MKQRTARSESRRLEAKRERSEYRADLWQKTVLWMRPGVLAIWAAFCLITLVILIAGDESMPWRLNQRVEQDIPTRVAFDVEDAPKTAQQRATARALAPNVYVFNEKPLVQVVSDVQSILDLPRSGADQARLKSELSSRGWSLADPELAALQQFVQAQKDARTYDRLISGLRQQLEKKYIVEPPTEPIRKLTPESSILRRLDQADRTVASVQLVPVSDAKAVEQVARQVASEVFPKELQPAAVALLTQSILGAPAAKGTKPNAWWRFDRGDTLREMDQAENSVPPVMMHYEPGDVIVQAARDRVLSNTDLDILTQEHQQYLEAQKTQPGLRQQYQLMRLGMAGIVVLVTLGLATYAVVYQNRQFQPARTAGFAALLLVVVLLSRITERAQYPWDLPVEFSVAYIVVAAALMAIAYDQRLALGAAAGLCVLMTLASRADLGLYLTLAAAGAVTIFLLKEVRTRSKIIAVGVLAAIAAGVTALSSGFIVGQDAKFVMVHAASAMAAAIAAGFFVQGVLPHFERLFGVATSMTLLEWSDANKPLLRRLAQEAPGTYSHSLILSQMAEEAAEAIGARGLLCRVGALYHDMGKIQKPEYFVENQEARMNRHDRLSPTMSLLIIVGHVKDGVEMARAYGVPKILHQFIGEHHGTTVVRYFHQQASEAARRKGRHPGEAAESEFRYPGPKPRSKETAILMLCDGCEGAVRSLAQPIPGRIESTVHQVVMDRLNDGQFDECDITLRELKLVEQSLVKSLAAIHHGRIKYPRQMEEGRAASEESEPSPSEPEPAKAGNGTRSGITPEVARQA